MAIAVASAITQQRLAQTADATLTWTSVTYSAGDTLVLLTAMNGSSSFPAPGTPAGTATLTWTLIVNSQGAAGNFTRTAAWVAKVPSGVTGTVTQTITRTSNSLSVKAVLYRLTGVDATTPINATTANYNSTTTDPLTSAANLQIASVSAGSILIAGGGDWGANTTIATSFNNSLTRTDDLNLNETGEMHFCAFSSSVTPTSLTNVRAGMDVSGGNGNWSSIMFEVLVAGGGASPQTTTAQIATLALTAVPGTLVPGAVTQAAQVGALALTAVPGTLVRGNVTVTAQIATLALTALPGTTTPGAVTKAAQIATLALTAVPGALTAGAVSVTAQIATLTLTAVPGTASTGSTVTAQIATLALTAVPGTLSVGAVTQVAQVATLTLTAVPGVATSGLTVIAQIATLTLTAVPGTKTTGAITQAAQIATLALTAVPGVLTLGAVTKVAQVATLTLTAVPGVLNAGVTTVAQVATLTLTALPGALAVGGVTVAAQIATITLIAVPAVFPSPYDPNPEHITVATITVAVVAQRSRVTIEQRSRHTIGI